MALIRWRLDHRAHFRFLWQASGDASFNRRGRAGIPSTGMLHWHPPRLHYFRHRLPALLFAATCSTAQLQFEGMRNTVCCRLIHRRIAVQSEPSPDANGVQGARQPQPEALSPWPRQCRKSQRSRPSCNASLTRIASPCCRTASKTVRASTRRALRAVLPFSTSLKALPFPSPGDKLVV